MLIDDTGQPHCNNQGRMTLMQESDVRAKRNGRRIASWRDLLESLLAPAEH